MRLVIALTLLSSIILADKTAIQFSGVDVSYKDKDIYIKRLIDSKCKKVDMTPENVFGGDFAAKSVPQECKKSFITSLGSVQPIKIDNEVETVGELEVLKFLEILEFEPASHALIDARASKWYKKLTIPKAINIPYAALRKDKDFSKEYVRALKLLNIKKKRDGELDFSNAKKITVFCNGSWCVQSAWVIKDLIKMGYPKNKIFWFRGGLEDWIGLGFTAVVP